MAKADKFLKSRSDDLATRTHTHTPVCKGAKGKPRLRSSSLRPHSSVRLGWSKDDACFRLNGPYNKRLAKGLYSRPPRKEPRSVFQIASTCSGSALVTLPELTQSKSRRLTKDIGFGQRTTHSGVSKGTANPLARGVPLWQEAAFSYDSHFEKSLPF